MKKRICLLFLAAAFALSACGGANVNVNVNIPSGSDEKVEKEEVPKKKEAAEDSVPNGDTQEEAKKLPVYKLVSKYFSERYDGKEKEDGEGNPLEGKQVLTVLPKL